MALHGFLSLVAMAAALGLTPQQPARWLAVATALVAGVLASMGFGIVTVRVTSAEFFGWLVVVVLGALLWAKQNTRTGATLCSVLLFASVLPILRLLGVVH